MNDEKREDAKKRLEELKELKDFYRKLITYVAVNIGIIIINLVKSPDNLWFYWVTIFWGIGILFHARNIFVPNSKFLGKEWREKQIKKRMKKAN